MNFSSILPTQVPSLLLLHVQTMTMRHRSAFVHVCTCTEAAAAGGRRGENVSLHQFGFTGAQTAREQASAAETEQ